jgi:hypothetical protein
VAKSGSENSDQLAQVRFHLLLRSELGRAAQPFSLEHADV